jgi:ABC-type sulfate transport system permease component
VDAARNSLLYAGATVLISVSLGFLASYALTRPAAINRVIDPILMLPLGASAVTLGLGFLLVFNRPPLDLRASPLLVPLAHSLVALPFVVRSLQPVLQDLDKEVEEAAATLGASRSRIFLRVTVPLVLPAIVAGSVLCWARALGEFGATLLFGGNVQGTTQTLPTLVLSVFQRDPADAPALALPLIAVALVVLVGLRDKWLRPVASS